jgi:DNA-binding NtrC family response regulator
MKEKKGQLLIVDDDEDIRRTLGDRLRADGYDVKTAANGAEGLRQIRCDAPEVVLLDMQMPEMDGLDVLRQLRTMEMSSTVIVITAYGSIESAVAAMREGAFDFVAKPFEMERMHLAVEKAMQHERLRRDVRYLRETSEESIPALVYRSPQMQEVVALAQRAAESKATVLLSGESGTGKGVLARAIHAWSGRRERPFVAVNCVALSENLLESELFGHEKGAFTGAEQRRKGRFEVAHSGTIFLDEIGATQTSLQLKLLKVLQEGAFERVGGEESIGIDVRVVAATNRDLRQLIAEDHFLEDLYYRLNVIAIPLLPLRERRDDIEALAHFFLLRFAAETKRVVTGIDESAMQCLLQYNWPGNIRELENAIERAVVLGRGESIGVDDLPEQVVVGAIDKNASVKMGYHAALEESKRQIVQSALAQTGGNQSQAAELLGVHRVYLSRLIKNLGLR